MQEKITETKSKLTNNVDKMIESNKLFRKEHVKYIIEKCYDSCLKIIKNDKREEENMFTDKTTGDLKIDFQTDIGKVTGTITEPLPTYSDLKSFKATKLVSPPITMSSDDIKNMLSLHVKDYHILCPGKVVKVDFTDNTSEKMVLKDPDVFDIHRCLFIAIAKHLYKDIFTHEGIEHKATLLSYEKKYAKIVNSAIKDHEKKEKEKLLKLQKEKEEKERIKRKRAKNLKRREQLRKKRIEEQIEIQKEAIIRANEMVKKESDI